jgi:hypothetical protein
LLNIFYDREEELDYLKKAAKEEASINFKDEKEGMCLAGQLCG